MAKRVTVSDLRDQLGTAYPRPFLYCTKCGARYSAHVGDYFSRPPGYVFRCCHRNMLLATERCEIRQVARAAIAKAEGRE